MTDIKALKAAGRAALLYYDVVKENPDKGDAAYDVCYGAADEIERLREEMNAALIDFKEVGDCLSCFFLKIPDENTPCDVCCYNNYSGNCDSKWQWRGLEANDG